MIDASILKLAIMLKINHTQKHVSAVVTVDSYHEKLNVEFVSSKDNGHKYILLLLLVSLVSLDQAKK